MRRRADLVLDVRNQTGEGLVWDAQSRGLWWTDIPGRHIHHLATETGLHVRYPTAGRAGCLALRRIGGLVVAMEHDIGFFDPERGTFETRATPEAGESDNRFNDGRCDRRGRFFAGSMHEPRTRDAGVLWRFDTLGVATAIAGGVTVANGLAWSPDDRLMYWADTFTQRIWTFDYDIDSGTVANRRLWLDAKSNAVGFPDGAAVDAEGCYWSARYMSGAVIRFTPDGRVDRVIEVPTERVTMCAFGGADLRTLYITTAWNRMTDAERAADPHAGGLFAINAGVTGLPEPRFAA